MRLCVSRNLGFIAGRVGISLHRKVPDIACLGQGVRTCAAGLPGETDAERSRLPSSRESGDTDRKGG